MKKLIPLVFVILFLFNSEKSKAQCTFDSLANFIYGFNDPNGGIFTGYLCGFTDSVGTFGSQGYYDGDAYQIRLVGGYNTTFEVSDCNGNPVSLTVLDSINQIIPGAYSAANCPNSVSFNPPYTGYYYILMNLNGVCGGGGSSLIGNVHAKITQGVLVPACPPEAYQINDTICGAIPLVLNDPYTFGSSNLSFPTDPLDGQVTNLGFTCSEPNHTMWYTYTPTANADTLYIHFATPQGSTFHSWLGIFSASNPSDPCRGGLNYIDCIEGFDDNTGIDTVQLSIYNLTAGTVYYFMTDGFQGSTGDFGIRLESSDFFNQVQAIKSDNFSIYPNPASTEINLNLKLRLAGATVTVTNIIGEQVFEKRYNTLQTEKISTVNWTQGMYFVKIASGNDYVIKKVFVIN